jgi:hypothetical protein
MKKKLRMKKKLSTRDHELIGALKAIRNDLRRQASNLTDAKIAEKFEVSEGCIYRVPVLDS